MFFFLSIQWKHRHFIPSSSFSPLIRWTPIVPILMVQQSPVVEKNAQNGAILFLSSFRFCYCPIWSIFHHSRKKHWRIHLPSTHTIARAQALLLSPSLPFLLASVDGRGGEAPKITSFRYQSHPSPPPPPIQCREVEEEGF